MPRCLFANVFCYADGTPSTERHSCFLQNFNMSIRAGKLKINLLGRKIYASEEWRYKVNERLLRQKVKRGAPYGTQDGSRQPFKQSSKELKSKIVYVQCRKGGGADRLTFQLLMLSPNLLKSKTPYIRSFAKNRLSF